MRELICVAENLRLVQQARRKFLEFWAVENNCINPMLDRMADDLLDDFLPCLLNEEDEPKFEPPASSGEIN